MKFVVLGGYGIIGKVVTADLFKFARDAQIVVAGRDGAKAKAYAQSFRSSRVKSASVDIQNKGDLVKLLKGSVVAVNCVQYYFNEQIMQACIAAGTSYVDLGGMFHHTRKQLMLDNEFKRKKITAVLGIGAAPGISNILAVYGAQFMDKVKSVEIVFGDKDDTKYNQSFVLPYSFRTLIDEYTLSPAVFENGKWKFVQAHSGTKTYKFGSWGTREGFLTLHSEIATLPLSLKHKGIRNCEFRVTFPKDFSEKIQTIIELGFASSEMVTINGARVRIIDVSSAVMDKLLPKSGTVIKDQEIVRVILDGKMVMDALAVSDGKTSAGVLDTGIPCSIAAQMIARGVINDHGVYAPETAVPAQAFFAELGKRGIKILKNNVLVKA